VPGNNKPKTLIRSTCGMLLLAITRGCGRVIGLLRGFWKIINFVFRVKMGKPWEESQEWIRELRKDQTTFVIIGY